MYIIILQSCKIMYIVFQCSDNDSVFFLDHNRSKCAEIVLYPGEKCEQTIVCFSPSLSGMSGNLFHKYVVNLIHCLFDHK